MILVGTIASTVNVYAYLTGAPVAYIENPFFIVQPVAIVGSVFEARALRRRYDRVTQEMNIAERSDTLELLLNIVPSWSPWLPFLAALVQIAVRVWALGGLSGIYRESGLIAIIGWAIMNPL